jgi:Zn-dependent protease with chaperone function
MDPIVRTIAGQTGAPVTVEPWRSEMTLKVFVILISISIWFGLVVSIFGIIYVAIIGLMLFAAHLFFIATVRGNAVRVSPEQYGDLYARVERLCSRAGLTHMPETYVMQAGGSLNALATKFLRSRMIIIFSDLLEACEDDERAQDMIIGHEIGHIKQGHLDGYWFLLPGLWAPFLGQAYSRACEYTCDRYGYALAADRSAALKGLAILSAGRKYGPRVNYLALVKQREKLDTALMTLGTWFMSHPPMCDRIAALDPALDSQAPARTGKGAFRAAAAVTVFFLLMFGGTVAVMVLFVKSIQQATSESFEQNSVFGSDSSRYVLDSAFVDSAALQDAAYEDRSEE